MPVEAAVRTLFFTRTGRYCMAGMKSNLLIYSGYSALFGSFCAYFGGGGGAGVVGGGGSVVGVCCVVL